MTAIGTASVVAGSQFETSFAKASTLFGDVNVDTDGLKTKILELSDSTGLAANELNEGLYQALSAGVPVTKDMGSAMDFLETSTQLAKGGFTSTSNSVDILSTVLNGYKMDVKDADKVSDMLLMTQNKGKTTVDELAHSMAQVTPTASAMNVQFDQVSASLATMTAQGIPTSQATTSLNQMLAELGKSGTQANTALMEATQGTKYAGKSFQELMKDGVPLNEVLDLMSDYAETNDKSLLDMFSSIEAGKGALSLAGQNSEAYTKNLDAMRNSEGATKEAADKMNDTFDVQKDKLIQIGKNKLIEFYESIKDTLKDVIKVAIKFVEKLDVKKVVTGLSILLGVLASIYATISAVQAINRLALFVTKIKELGGLSGIISTLSTNLSMIGSTALSSILPIVGIVAAVVAAIALFALAIKQLWDENEGFRNAITTAWESIKRVISKAYDKIIKPILDALKKAFKQVMDEGVKPLWDGFKKFVSELITKLSELWLTLEPFVNWFIDTFGPTIAGVISTVIGTVGGVFSTILSTLGGVFDSIGQIVGGIIDVFSGIIEFLTGVFSGDWDKAWEGVKKIFGGVWDSLVGIVSGVWDTILGLFSCGGQIFNGIADAIGNVFKTIINLLIGGLNWVIAQPFRFINNILNGIRNLSILGAKPFKGLWKKNPIPVYQIPELEKGGVLRRGQVGLLEGNGAEAVVPLEKNKHWISAVAKDFVKYMPQSKNEHIEQTVNFNNPVETPDEVARTMRMYGRYGLAGAQ